MIGGEDGCGSMAMLPDHIDVPDGSKVASMSGQFPSGEQDIRR